MLRADGSGFSVTSSSSTSEIQAGWVHGTSSTSNTFSNGQMYVTDYTASGLKSIFADHGAERNTSIVEYLTLTTGGHSTVGAITSITFSASDNLDGNVWLYGIS